MNYIFSKPNCVGNIFLEPIMGLIESQPRARVPGTVRYNENHNPRLIQKWRFIRRYSHFCIVFSFLSVCIVFFSVEWCGLRHLGAKLPSPVIMCIEYSILIFFALPLGIIFMHCCQHQYQTTIHINTHTHTNGKRRDLWNTVVVN